MRPEERANADAINASIEAMITGKKKPATKPVADEKEPKTTGFYTQATFIILTLLIIAAGILDWRMMSSDPDKDEGPAPVRQASIQTSPSSGSITWQPPVAAAPVRQVIVPVVQPPVIEYNVYHVADKPKPAPTVAAPEELNADDQAHGQAGMRYALDYCIYKYKIGDARPIRGSITSAFSSSRPEGGWGKHTVQGTVTFDYYDMSGSLKTVTKNYTARTEPANNGNIRITDLQID